MKLLKRFLGQNVPDLGRKRALEFIAQHRFYRFNEPLTQFERDVSRESVTNNDIDFAFENVSPLDIPDKVQWRLLQSFKDFLRELVPFGVFFSDGQQTDSRTTNTEDDARIYISHDRELLQVQRLAINVCTHVEQDRGFTLLCGQNRRKCGTIDHGKRAGDHLGRGHHGPSVARTDDARNPALTHQVGDDTD